MLKFLDLIVLLSNLLFKKVIFILLFKKVIFIGTTRFSQTKILSKLKLDKSRSLHAKLSRHLGKKDRLVPPFA